jgi:hypothetical protein
MLNKAGAYFYKEQPYGAVFLCIDYKLNGGVE